MKAKIKEQPAKVPRHTVDPDAERATLKIRNRLLLGPVKNATENARRWLLGKLATGLSPSDHTWDLDTNARTLDALIKAPGTVRFTTDRVHVVLDLPLPPQPHARLAKALADLDSLGLRSTDDLRPVTFRLAPRPCRADLPRPAPER